MRFTCAERVAEMFPNAHPENEEWRARFIVFRAEHLVQPPILQGCGPSKAQSEGATDGNG